LTKKFEEFARGPASDLAARYEKDGPPKGEVVLLWAPAPHREAGWEEVDNLLGHALSYLRVKEASALVAEITGHRKSEVYARAVELQKKP
ncbi:MAG: 16S rRNA (cytidine(1402)-2'-O)-methyltransferase, partial [Alphaproteobacteria bacterium]|nr:16S rRNA (cytidine(1402)-2'-O)-methyltransferase [Alphaproteobacteria bacterium]